ncbi:MAG: TonB family protein [Candidatus Acidiferrales bacterium]
MTEAGTKQIEQVVDGKFRLGQLVGRTQRTAVFLTEYDGQPVKKVAIKLIPADSVDALAQLSRWKQAAKLSHPHLVRLLEMGRCQVDHADMLYVVTEYAEENLSAVIARRALEPDEARALLGPVVDALAYIHAQGFVHCRLKPSNIMADDDLLKISADGLCRIGESSGSPGNPGPYDPPEAAGGRISPAGDVWSLGITLTEALTQRLPMWERTNQAEPALPSNLPPEILDLARHCVRRDPQMRWTVADIAARLQSSSPAPPNHLLLNPQPSFAKPAAIGVAALVAVVLLAVLFAPRVFKRSSHEPIPSTAQVAAPAVNRNQANEHRTQRAPDQSPTPSHTQSTDEPLAQSKVQPQVVQNEKAKPANKPVPSATSHLPVPATLQNAPLASKPAPEQHAVPPSAQLSAARSSTTSVEKTGEKHLVASNSAPSPAPVRSESSAAATSNGTVRGKVVQQILPDAPQKARDTIRGKVRLSVKVNVDESGNVTQATLDAPGPSQYFADRTLAAAKLWKFAPAKVNGRNIPSQWLLYFEIDPATTTVHPKQITP